ncbi:type II secretion system protein [Rubritalea marina]|uniref:type II secretion system protein n=1 Tax=Rubritalea marina TaxID=361055 RepID=UPI000371B024|nr:type II secretion system protein [Rubritalea marina]
MKKSNHHSNRNGFSLVELLVVIAIIATLAGVSAPVIMGQLKKAKITEGQKMAHDIIFAIEQFEQKYGYLPYLSSKSYIRGEKEESQAQSTSGAPGDVEMYVTINARLLNVLMGKDDDVNPNNVQFFDAQDAKNGVNGIVYDDDGEPKMLMDPWGYPFAVVIDYTGENKINFAHVPALKNVDFKVYQDKDGNPMRIHSVPAVVASPGPDGIFDDIDDVKTW